MPPVVDIAWYEHFDEAAEAVRRKNCILLAKPAGQGLICRNGVELW
jgi:hypothetical protein